jgi:hypothetical protein
MNPNTSPNFALRLWCGLRDFVLPIWRSLPIYVQTGIVIFASAAGTFLGGWLWDGPSCWTWLCLKHTLGAACAAGIAAERTFKMRPGCGPHADETPYTGS